MPNCFFIYFSVDRNKCNFFFFSFFLPSLLPPLTTPEEIYRENKSLGKARNKRNIQKEWTSMIRRSFALSVVPS